MVKVRGVSAVENVYARWVETNQRYDERLRLYLLIYHFESDCMFEGHMLLVSY